MAEKQIIIKKDNYLISARANEKEIVQLDVEETGKEKYLGSIYVGRVKNIVSNIQSAFVEFSAGQMCYLSLSENPKPVFCNKKKNATIQVGDYLIVQIQKESMKMKPAVGTCQFHLQGKYMALIHGKTGIGISAKIKDIKERDRLYQLCKSDQNEQYGLVIRTNAQYEEEQVIFDEIVALQKRYQDICTMPENHGLYTRLYQALPEYLCRLRDARKSELEQIITDEPEVYQEIKQYLRSDQRASEEKLRFYQDTVISLDQLYGVSKQLRYAGKEKIWLKSGANIIIQETHTCTVIDVNTGKMVFGKKAIEDTFWKVNLEAAREIAKQIRLRNLSGMILIDFINLRYEQDQEKLFLEVKKILEDDPIQTEVVDMTALHLIEVTRKKVRRPLREQCPTKWMF